MTSAVRSVWLAGLLSAAGCSFSGASGSAEPPQPDAASGDAGPSDAAPEDAPGTGVDAPPAAVTCNDFTEIEGGRYYLIDEVVTKGTALSTCDSIAGAHLVTFETVKEVSDVVDGLTLAVKVWTGVKQTPPGFSLTGMAANWANQIKTARTNLPPSFPWRSGQPDDGGGFIAEDSAENECALGPDKKFEDVHHTKNMFRTLCECPPAGPGGE